MSEEIDGKKPHLLSIYSVPETVLYALTYTASHVMLPTTTMKKALLFPSYKKENWNPERRNILPKGLESWPSNSTSMFLFNPEK